MVRSITQIKKDSLIARINFKSNKISPKLRLLRYFCFCTYETADILSMITIPLGCKCQVEDILPETATGMGLMERKLIPKSRVRAISRTME
jgi:hypothetical protein